jgi:hypothetical protein
MRSAIPAMTLALTLVTGPLHAVTRKKPPADVGHVGASVLTRTSVERSSSSWLPWMR